MSKFLISCGGTGGHVSPGISLDGSVSLRFSPTLALALGLMGWFENAGKNVESAASSNAYIGSTSVTPTPIATPAYHLASGTQVFIGPYLGLQFGP